MRPTSDISTALQSLHGNAFVTLRTRLDHGGSLQARRLSSGAVQLYWRYSRKVESTASRSACTTPSAPPKKLQSTARGYSIAAALERCRELAALHAERAATGGLRALKVEQRRAAAEEREIAAEHSLRTLRNLLDTYVDHLKTQGRRSHVDARQIFERHVVEAWPRQANALATELTADQVLDMLRRLLEAGKGRTANKLRSYLRAAYQCALDVRVVASIPLAFKAFAVQVNPVAQTRRSPQYDRADKRPFTLAELRAYWRLIADVPGTPAAVLRLHLLTGGQRIEQLVRLHAADVGDDAIRLYDLKGRPGQGARPHLVPLVGQAQSALRELANGQGVFAISTTGGKKPISVRTMAGWANDLVGEAIVGFQLKRIRSGIETLLASSGVSREVRGHLQSHGLTGVQARHYDGHDYMAEKRQALDVMVEEICKTAASRSRSETLQMHRRAFGRARLLARRRPSTVAADAQPIGSLG
jgi:integrase